MSKKSNKSGLIIFIILIILLAVAFFTNPDEQAHKDALKEKTNTIVEEIVAERSDGVSAGVWKLGGANILGAFIDKNVSVKDYGVFSIPILHWDKKSYPVGIGAFGRVYITKQLSKEVVQPIVSDMEDKINDSLPDIFNRVLKEIE